MTRSDLIRLRDADTLRTVARAICREKCAFYGEPPCFEIGDDDSLSPYCDEPGCEAEAKAALAALIERTPECPTPSPRPR